jgi:hypothetical protein
MLSCTTTAARRRRRRRRKIKNYHISKPINLWTVGLDIGEAGTGSNPEGGDCRSWRLNPLRLFTLVSILKGPL